MPPPEFLRKVKETQKSRDNRILSTLLKQNLQPNYRLKAPCSCLSLKLNRNQEEHNTPPTYIFTLVRMTLT